MTSFSSHGHTAKPRERGSKSGVKPILRKLTQSEKNSLDLDRSAAEQGQGLGIEYGHGHGHGHVGSIPGASRSSGLSNHDVHSRRGYHYHHRSTSGTSQFSTATTGSGQGGARSFVHPFQQTPRPYTPPAFVSTNSYQNSLRESELDNSNNSPALTEDEDQAQAQYQLQSPSQTQIHSFRSPSNLSNHNSPPSITGAARDSSSPNISHSHSHSQHSQHQQHPLRVTTSKQGSSSRLALAASHTSLHNTILSSEIGSPTDSITMSPTSAIRSSLDKGFRIRSRSEVTEPKIVRSETIQEARRKFQEKEEAKEEKAAREEIRALEKRQMKEARQIERGHRRSSASNETHTRSKRSKSDLTTPMQEKDGFVGRAYGEVRPLETPTFAAAGAGAGRGEGEYAEKRSGTAKLKTHSAWTKFVMWIRTRFIRMGNKK